ncbi:DNA translocase FtsK [Duncaniella sp. B8]|nr:DNA translocase FtsK [Duncaniella sp. B8]
MGGLVIILYLTELKRIYGVASQGIRTYNERQAQRRAERERIREAEEAERLAREAAEEAEAQRRAAVEAETQRQAAIQPAAAVAVAMQPAMTKNAVEGHAENESADRSGNSSGDIIEETDEEIAEIEVTDFEDNGPGSDHLQSAGSREDSLLRPLFAGDDSDITDSYSRDDSNDIESDDETPADSTETASVQNAEEEEADFNTPLFADSDNDSDDETEQHGNSDPSAQTALQAPLAPTTVRPATAEEVLASEPYNPRAELSLFRFPSVDLLRPTKDNGPSVDIQEMEFNKRRLTETLRTFGVEISKIEATIGPTVTLYEIIPAEGVRTRSIRSLGDDLQLQLAAEGVRIIAPIPAKGTIGIEVPNKDPQVVSMRSVLDSEVYRNSKMELPMALGKTISNDIFMADLAKMPHLLVAGATGMGKSVGLNAIITSLLYKKHPSELKFVLIDPKRVELSLYRELERHYLASLPGEDAIITDMSKVVTVLNSLCIEMDNRLSLLEQAGARNIKEYNDKFIARKLNPEKHRFLPYIVLIIDEFADLIIRQGKEIENPVSRLAAVARAAGIHLIIATQRPTVNVITGGIKLNIPGRIAFRVIQGNDSRTILDQLGANQLIGRGDMLFSINGKLERVQCAFIDTPEVSAICENIGSQVGYQSPYELPEYTPEGEGGNISGATLGDRDPLFDECARLVVSTDTASTSSLQRRYSIGYNRAGKIMDQMEAAGIVGPSQGGKPRQVLVDAVTLEHILENR